MDMNKKIYQIGENEELDRILRKSETFSEASGKLFDIIGVLDYSTAIFYLERFYDENEIVNSPLYKLMREDE